MAMPKKGSKKKSSGGGGGTNTSAGGGATGSGDGAASAPPKKEEAPANGDSHIVTADPAPVETLSSIEALVKEAVQTTANAVLKDEGAAATNQELMSELEEILARADQALADPITDNAGVLAVQ